MPPLGGFNLTPQAIHRLSRYSNTIWTEHRDFSFGICQDVPSYASPENAVWDALDYVFDRPGKIRKRGGTKALFSGTQTLAADRLGWYQSGALDGLTRLYAFEPNLSGGSNTTIYNIDTGTGAATSVATGPPSGTFGSPFPYQGSLVFPVLANGGGSVLAIGGAAASHANYTQAGAVATVTAGSSTVTVTGTTFTTHTEVGAYVQITGATDVYIGRIVAVNSNTSLSVDPVPAVGFTSAAGGVTTTNRLFVRGYGDTPANVTIGAATGCAFQQRIILANTTGVDGGANNTVFPRRVIWSILPTEVGSSAGLKPQGLMWAFNSGFESNNFFDIPGSDPITAVTTVGEGQLIIFTQSSAYRLTGTITTQTATSSGYSFDVRLISSRVGCIGDNTIQQTPRGIVFAARDGVYLYDGAQMRPLMQGRIANYYRADTAITGSTLLQDNHYIVGDLICNLDTVAWSRLSTQAVMRHSTRDNVNNVYALRQFGDLSSPTRFTNGQVVRADTILKPDSTVRNDANGTAVEPTLITRAYVEGDAASLKRFSKSQLEYDMRGGSPTLTIRADTRMDPGDSGAFSGTPLLNGAGNSTLSTTTQPSEVTFHVMPRLKSGFAIEHKVQQTGGSDSTEILGIKHGWQQKRDGRST